MVRVALQQLFHENRRGLAVYSVKDQRLSLRSGARHTSTTTGTVTARVLEVLAKRIGG